METREILLKADKVSVVFERTADGKIRVTNAVDLLDPEDTKRKLAELKPGSGAEVPSANISRHFRCQRVASAAIGDKGLFRGMSNDAVPQSAGYRQDRRHL
jgi:hypothetical protein